MFIVSTCSGFIIYGTEYIHRETPTEVTISAVKAFTAVESNKRYFERLEALGYDNMCNLMRKIHISGREGRLDSLQSFFWSELVNRVFVDGFHLSNHTCPLCDKTRQEGTCFLDTSLPKFDIIFPKQKFEKYMKSKNFKDTRVNDEVKLYIHITYIKLLYKLKLYIHRL